MHERNQIPALVRIAIDAWAARKALLRTDSCWARGLAALISMSGRPSLFEWVFSRQRNCAPLDLESALPLLPVLARSGAGDNAPLSSARRTALADQGPVRVLVLTRKSPMPYRPAIRIARQTR